ncbi:SRPBCC family protein [Pedomonas sp. V897]|uniref:SRPBCC family protein n=1 Tax=Pedomonas sp. V897 TaxID=3446482 RepID=UPI003EE3E88C
MKTIATTLHIAAAPERVWAVLTDFARYPDWNPFIRSIDGPLEAGGRLAVEICPPGQKGMRFRPRVLAVEPARALRWKGSVLIPGIFDGEHVFRLEPREGGTLLHHGETFSGVLPALMPARSFAPVEAGFRSMNEALARRVCA